MSELLKCGCGISEKGEWYGYCPAREADFASLPSSIDFVVSAGLSLADQPEDWTGCLSKLILDEVLSRKKQGLEASLLEIKADVCRSMRLCRCDASK